MTPNQIRWTVAATVSIETPEGDSITRGSPTFEVWASNAREAHSKSKDILTASWRGPTKVEIQMGLCDSGGNYFSADEDGIKK